MNVYKIFIKYYLRLMFKTFISTSKYEVEKRYTVDISIPFTLYEKIYAIIILLYVMVKYLNILPLQLFQPVILSNRHFSNKCLHLLS